MLRLVPTCAFCLIASFLVPPACAQIGEGPVRMSSVSTSGSSQVTLAPELLRARFVVVGQGDNVADALKGLKKQKEKAESVLADLDAKEGSIRTKPPRVDTREAQRALQVNQMLAPGGGFAAAAAIQLDDFGGGVVQNGNQAPNNKPVPKLTVTSEMTADWELKSQAVEDLLILSHELKEKLTKADVGGYKAMRKLDAAKMQKLNQMGMNPFGVFNATGDPAEVILYFVAKIPEPQREVALKRAFQKAKTAAEQLARISGHRMGELQSVSHSWDGLYAYSQPAWDPFANTSTVQYLQQLQSRNSQSGIDVREVTGASPGPLKFTVSVQTSFALVGPAGG